MDRIPAVAALCGLTLILTTGCGAPADPLPPALNIPVAVKDLTAVQRGGNIVVQFTAPALTQEDLGLKAFRGIDLRVADQTQPNVPIPEPGKSVTVSIPAAPWEGKDVAVIVRLSGPKGRWSGFSNAVRLAPGAPIPVPSLKAESHPQGVRLTWPGSDSGLQHRINRDDAALGVAEGSEYIDKTAQFGKEYRYSVQAFTGLRESEFSPVVTITPKDEFPPAPPKGLQAVAGLTSVELAWDRSPEPDVASYRVYRASPGGAFTVLADAIPGTAYSDRQIASGTTYRYRVTAVDASGNESEPSSEAEVRAGQ